MRILGIETSCDETAAAVVEDGGRILSNVVASQVKLHARYGGIVPEVASRQHLLSIVPVLERAMTGVGLGWHDLDGVAVTVGPGLPGSLLVGLNMAKAIALARGLPLLGINHLEGHIYAHWLEGDGEGAATFPCLCLIVSGGHTELVLMRAHGQFQSLGRTRDDAAGEAFDKAARILGLGYPGGPAIQEAAMRGEDAFPLPRARLKGGHDFSFSGVKTALWRLVEEIKGKAVGTSLPVADLAASFQEAVVDALLTNTLEVARGYRVKQILLVGGVAANSRLREAVLERSPLPVLLPRPALCTDNAAMIAACGYFYMRAGEVAGWDLDAKPGLRLG
jgi:N6-L-threonylcarbamoyladenine synthase